RIGSRRCRAAVRGPRFAADDPRAPSRGGIHSSIEIHGAEIEQEIAAARRQAGGVASRRDVGGRDVVGPWLALPSGYLGRSVSIDAGLGLACRNAYMSTSSASERTFSVYGGIAPRGART